MLDNAPVHAAAVPPVTVTPRISPSENFIAYVPLVMADVSVPEVAPATEAVKVTGPTQSVAVVETVFTTLRWNTSGVVMGPSQKLLTSDPVPLLTVNSCPSQYTWLWLPYPTITSGPTYAVPLVTTLKAHPWGQTTSPVETAVANAALSSVEGIPAVAGPPVPPYRRRSPGTY